MPVCKAGNRTPCIIIIIIIFRPTSTKPQAEILKLMKSLIVFTALHAMQTRSSDDNSVCLSVCLSDKRVLYDQTVERSVQIYIPYERTFSLVF